MKIKIHKGSNQIGGSIVEISTDKAKIIIDFGADLSTSKSIKNDIDIEGVTKGKIDCDAILLTHYHGDHIGLISRVLPDIPIYLGETAKNIQEKLYNRTNKSMLPIVGKFRTFKALDNLKFGDITVTPLFIDHSAFDAYMFLIKIQDIKILHTGDFRMHGFRGSKTIPLVKKYVGEVDYIISEGTLLSRSNKKIMTESQLEQRAKEIMKKYKYVFVYSASTNIDRIAAFYHANPKGKLFICDIYQKEILSIVTKNHNKYTDFYDFKYAYSYGQNLDELMQEKGFCMMIRQGEFFKQFLEKYKNNSIIIYSMWDGYLDDRALNENLVKFLKPYNYIKLHTSGHATKDDLRQLIEVVKPKKGIIPIHTENQEGFDEISGIYKVIKLKDNEYIEFS